MAITALARTTALMAVALLVGCGGGSPNPDAAPGDAGGDTALDVSAGDAPGDVSAGDVSATDAPADVSAGDAPEGDAPGDVTAGDADAFPGDTSSGNDGSADAIGGSDGGAGAGGAEPCGVLGWGLNTRVAIAPGASSVAFATPDGRLEMRRWSDGAVLGIDNGLFGASAVGYSPDGALFAASTNQSLKLWRVSDGAMLSSIPELAGAGAVALSNDGGVFAIRRNSQLIVWRPAGLLTVPLDNPGVAGVAVSPDGALVATSYQTATGSGAYPFEFHNGAWRVSDGQAVWSSSSGRSSMQTAANAVFSRDGTLVAFGEGVSGQMSIGRILRASDGSMVSWFNAEPMAFSDDGLAMVGGKPRFTSNYVIYRVSDGAAARTLTLPQNSHLLAAGFSTGTTAVAVVQAAGGESHQLYVDSVETRSIARASSLSAVGWVAMSPDATLVVTSGSPMRLWNAATSSVVTTLSGGVLRRQESAFSPDSSQLAVCGSSSASVMRVKSNGTVVAQPQPMFTIPVAARAIAFSPDGTLIATGNADNTANLWRASDGAAVHTLWNLTGHSGEVVGIAFSPDGARVATTASDKTIKLWRVADGMDLGSITTGATSVDRMTFLPDGGSLIGVGYTPSGARVWSIASGMVVNSLESSSNPVIAPSGQRMFMGVNGGIERFSLPGFADLGPVPLSATGGFVRSLGISADGSVLASVADSAVVRLWCLRD